MWSHKDYQKWMIAGAVLAYRFFLNGDHRGMGMANYIDYTFTDKNIYKEEEWTFTFQPYT